MRTIISVRRAAKWRICSVLVWVAICLAQPTGVMAEDRGAWQQGHVVLAKEFGLLDEMTKDDIKSMFEAFNGTKMNTLVVHFHGGLVSEDNAKKAAARLTPIYQKAGAYPMFFVWKSGLTEVLGQLQKGGQTAEHHRLFSLAGKFFKQLDKLRLDRLFSMRTRDGTGPAEQAPKGQTATTGFTRSAWDTSELLPARPATYRSNDAVAAGRSLPAPFIFPIAWETGQSTKPERVTERGARATVGPLAPPREPCSEALSWRAIAREAARKAKQRERSGRGHGHWTTIMEEALRRTSYGLDAQKIWQTMKCNTERAWQGDETHAGVAFYNALRAESTRRQQAGRPLRVVLVGHSTGAIYICNFLRAVARERAQSTSTPVSKATNTTSPLKFEVVFLAPACDFPLLDRTLQESGDLVEHLRIFMLNDDRERNDRLPDRRFPLYRGSLLYLISGVLETNCYYEAQEDGSHDQDVLCRNAEKPEIADTAFEGSDRPLVGMKRFYTARYKAWYPSIAPVERWVNDHGGFVWAGGQDSPEYAGLSVLTSDGFRCEARQHGGFVEDRQTLESLRYLLQNGFKASVLTHCPPLEAYMAKACRTETVLYALSCSFSNSNAQTYRRRDV